MCESKLRSFRISTVLLFDPLKVVGRVAQVYFSLSLVFESKPANVCTHVACFCVCMCIFTCMPLGVAENEASLCSKIYAKGACADSARRLVFKAVRGL